MNAGLGIAVKTYLDELANEPNPTFQEAKDEQKRKLPEMFVQANDINEDVARAFRLWDAVSFRFLFLNLCYLADFFVFIFIFCR